LAVRFGVVAFSDKDDALYQIKEFVIRFYELVLTRQPEVQGYKYWVGKLQKGDLSASDIAKNFFGSSEFTNKRYNNSSFIEITYLTLLGRRADDGGKAFWLEQLNYGKTREQMINGFIGSTEFRRIAEKYGIRLY
jgi:hypothetical protein